MACLSSGTSLLLTVGSAQPALGVQCADGKPVGFVESGTRPWRALRDAAGGHGRSDRLVDLLSSFCSRFPSLTAEGSLRSSGVPTGVPLAGKRGGRGDFSLRQNAIAAGIKSPSSA